MLDAMKDRNQPPIHAYPRLSNADLVFARIGGSGLGDMLGLSRSRLLIA